MSSLKRSSARTVVGHVLLLLAAALPSLLEARPVSRWAPQRIAAKAEFLAVAEVIEVTERKRVPKEKTRWRIPLLLMTAKLRVVRSFVVTGAHTIRDGGTVKLAYHVVDRENCKSIVNGPHFPALSPGDVFVFPLRRTKGRSAEPWELIHEENFGLLTPAVVAAAPEPGPGTGAAVAFLRSELAGALTHGTYGTLLKSAKYLSHLHDWDRQFAKTYELLERGVADDEERWLNIAVASYCAMGIPRPRVADLLRPWENQKLQATLVAKALKHVNAENLEDRFIALSIEQCSLHTWGTAVTISVNYSRHPTAM